MRFAVGVLCVAACATTPAPAPTNAHENRPVLVTQSKSPEPVAAPRRPRAVATRLTPDVVLSTIRGRYIAGVERCYRRHLKKDAGARGRVVVSFTVDPKGRARNGEARGVTEQVDGCITKQVRRWRFPVPRTHRISRFALRLELGAS